MVGYLGNAYRPARAGGNWIRSAYLGQKSGAGHRFIFATALVERLLDVIALVLIGSVAILLQSHISPLLAGAIKDNDCGRDNRTGNCHVVPLQEKLVSRLDRLDAFALQDSQIVSFAGCPFPGRMRSLHKRAQVGNFLSCWTAVIWLLDGIGNVLGVHIIHKV